MAAHSQAIDLAPAIQACLIIGLMLSFDQEITYDDVRDVKELIEVLFLVFRCAANSAAGRRRILGLREESVGAI
jgi:hypothetical protein